MPIPAPLADREKSQVRSFLLFREQVHDGPFYTAARSWNAFAASSSGSTTPRAYGQEQINQRYGLKNKATLDPFTAVEMPSSRMRKPERALPDFSERPFSALFVMVFLADPFCGFWFFGGGFFFSLSFSWPFILMLLVQINR